MENKLTTEVLKEILFEHVKLRDANDYIYDWGQGDKIQYDGNIDLTILAKQINAKLQNT